MKKRHSLAFAALLILSNASAETINLSGSGWMAQLDPEATWKNDTLYLPEELPANLEELPYNAPTGGWQSLNKGKEVAIPMTIDQYFLGSINTANYEGVSWVWRNFDAPADLDGKVILLNVARARMRAEIFINQKLAAYDVIGETPFSFDISKYVKAGQQNQIAIRLTNPGGRRGWSDIEPLKWGNYTYLGKSRNFTTLGDVEIDIKDQVYINDLFVKNILPTNGKRVKVQLEVINRRAETVEASLPFKVTEAAGDACIAETTQSATLQSGLNKITFEMQLDDAKLWSHEDPNLYKMSVSLNTASDKDEHSERFGLRTFEVRKGKSGGLNYYFNGKRFYFKTAIDWGYYTPGGDYATKNLSERSVDAALAMGQNGISFHRAIGEPLVMDSADEKGLTIYEEQGGFHSYKPFKEIVPGETEGFAPAQIKEKIRRMVIRDRNHPSLIIYSLSNEDNLFYKTRQDALKLINSLDDSRYVINTSGPLDPNAPAAPAGIDRIPNIKPYGKTIGYDYTDLHTAGNRAPLYLDEDFYQSIHRDEAYLESIYFPGEVNSVTGPSNWYKSYKELTAEGSIPAYDTNIYKENHDKTADVFVRWQLGTTGSGNIKTPDDVSMQAGRGMMYAHARHAQSIMCNNTADGFALNGWTTGPQSEGTSIDWESGILDQARNLKAPADSYDYWTRPLQISLSRKNGKYFKPGDSIIVESNMVNHGILPQGNYTVVYTIKDGDDKLCEFKQEQVIKLEGGDQFAKSLGDITFTAQAGWKAGYITLQAQLIQDGKVVADGSEQMLLQNRASYKKALQNVSVDVRQWDAAYHALSEGGAQMGAGGKRPDFIFAGDMSTQSMSGGGAINSWQHVDDILKKVKEGSTLIIRFDKYWADALYIKGLLSDKVTEWGGNQTRGWMGNGWGYLDHYIGYQSTANKGTIGTTAWEVTKDPYGFYPFASKHPLKAHGLYMCRPWLCRIAPIGYRVLEVQPTVAVILGTIEYGKGQIILNPCYQVDENTAFTDMLFYNMILMNK